LHQILHVIITLHSQQVQNTNDKEKEQKRQGQNEKLNC